MNRRAFLRTAGIGGLGGLVGFAGCTGEDDQATPTPTPTPTEDDEVGGVYFQPHVAETAPVGRSEAEWYGVAAAYTHPHQFWVVTGGDVSLVDVDEDDDAHFHGRPLGRRDRPRPGDGQPLAGVLPRRGVPPGAGRLADALPGDGLSLRRQRPPRGGRHLRG